MNTNETNLDHELEDLFEDDETQTNDSDALEETVQEEESQDIELTDEDHIDEPLQDEETQAPLTEKVPISDLPMTIHLEVGSTQLSFNKLLDLEEGQTLDLEDELTDQVRLLVNGHCIGQAEVVKIGDKFGIRITNLLKRTEIGK